MKNIIFILLFIGNLFAYTIYQAKVIGEVKIPGLFSYNLTIFCINDHQYIGNTSASPSSSLSPFYGKDGKVLTCN